jgi:hypothetical protein
MPSADQPGRYPLDRIREQFPHPRPRRDLRPDSAGLTEITEPILLIEILSPGNPMQTWTNVRAYTTILSVQEILVIRTASMDVQLLSRAPDGSWPDVPLAVETGELTLESTGLLSPLTALCAGTWLVEET